MPSFVMPIIDPDDIVFFFFHHRTTSVEDGCGAGSTSIGGIKGEDLQMCNFQQEVRYLSLISDKGISTDRGKTEVIISWPLPTTISELKSILRFASYY